MNTPRTRRALESLTDPGLFEELATAILREEHPDCRSLSHTGTNSDGKTVTSPLDGICFERSNDAPHMVVVHHSTAARSELKRKWLNDPENQEPDASTRRPKEVGDLVKVARIAKAEREERPDLRVTLILTTNREPQDPLIREVGSVADRHGIEADIWSGSRLCHFLDNDPTGQWLRRTYLGIEQEVLSEQLFRDLAKENQKHNHPHGRASDWIAREIDRELEEWRRPGVTFLVAPSGFGKSVACYRRLESHLDRGGLGLVLRNETVTTSLTLEHAVTTTLRQIHPKLVEGETPALSFGSATSPLLIVVEDIARSGQAPQLAEKLGRWHESSPKGWQLLCPIWPEVLTSLGELMRKRVEPLLLSVGKFTEDEGIDAVQARAASEGVEVTSLEARSIAHALGNDPLFVALYDITGDSRSPSPLAIVRQFIDGALERASSASTYTSTEYRQALRIFGQEMLQRRALQPFMGEIISWESLQGTTLAVIRCLLRHGELVQLAGPSDRQEIHFRHDRVRNQILADAIVEMDQENRLDAGIVSDPFFAELLGVALASAECSLDCAQRIQTTNPLALFYAFRWSAKVGTSRDSAIVRRIHDWLDTDSAQARSHLSLRWKALALLAETDWPDALEIARRIGEYSPDKYLTLLRNGDIAGGINLCSTLDPGVGAPWRDIQVAHAKHHYSSKLAVDLERNLRREDLPPLARLGSLRMAGHLADSRLAPALVASWEIERSSSYLPAYLWAFAHCCGEDAETYLEPAVNFWASLSDKPEEDGLPSARNAVAARHLRWALRRWPPADAVEYFVERGREEALRRPIFILLGEVDHPAAVAFTARELAERSQKEMLHPMHLTSVWERAQEQGRPMSEASRNRLLGLWNSDVNDEDLRVSAFSLWKATKRPGDIDLLRSIPMTHALSERLLEARLVRGDQASIPALIERIRHGDKPCYWWQFGRYVWSSELTDTLDWQLTERSRQVERKWLAYFDSDGVTYELVMRLRKDAAEEMLLKHWSHIRFSSYFVSAALYFATPALLQRVQESIEACPEPASLVQYLSQHYGINTQGRAGVQSKRQIEVLEPYLDLLSSNDISSFWEACNEHGWFDVRAAYFDDRLEIPFLDWLWDPVRAEAALDKMVENDDTGWIGHWVERFERTGVSWTRISELLLTWLGKRDAVESFRLVAAAIGSRGKRTDLNRLRRFSEKYGVQGQEVLEDTRFLVYSREPH